MIKYCISSANATTLSSTPCPPNENIYTQVFSFAVKSSVYLTLHEIVIQLSKSTFMYREISFRVGEIYSHEPLPINAPSPPPAARCLLKSAAIFDAPPLSLAWSSRSLSRSRAAV